MLTSSMYDFEYRYACCIKAGQDDVLDYLLNNCCKKQWCDINRQRLYYIYTIRKHDVTVMDLLLATLLNTQTHSPLLALWSNVFSAHRCTHSTLPSILAISKTKKNNVTAYIYTYLPYFTQAIVERQAVRSKVIHLKTPFQWNASLYPLTCIGPCPQTRISWHTWNMQCKMQNETNSF